MDNQGKVQILSSLKQAEYDGRLQVRADMKTCDPLVDLRGKIDVEVFEYSPTDYGSDEDFEGRSIDPVSFVLGNTIFYEVRVKKEFWYEVTARSPISDYQPGIDVHCFTMKEMPKELFHFTADENGAMIAFNLPDDAVIRRISPEYLIIENTSYAQLDDAIELKPSNEKVALFYDPFNRHVALRFSLKAAKRLSAKDGLRLKVSQSAIIAGRIMDGRKKDDVEFCYEPVTSFGMKGFEQGNFYNPGDVATNKNGHVYVVDTFNHQVKRLKRNLEVERVIGGYGKEPGKLMKPSSAAIGPDGFIYVADMMNNRIQVFDNEGAFVKCWGSYGKGDGQLANPLAIEVDEKGCVYISDMNNRISVFGPQGSFVDIWGRGGHKKGEFSYPSALAFDNETGLLYVSDTNNNRIQVLDKGKVIDIFDAITGLTGGFLSPSGIEVYKNSLYIADSANNRLVVLDKRDGRLLAVYGKEGTGPGEFSDPRGIAIMDNQFILVSDRYNNRIQVLRESRKKGRVK